ncbi:MAG: hypothetical protein ACE5HP_06080 [Gemmatimonadota bacterium]
MKNPSDSGGPAGSGGGGDSRRPPGEGAEELDRSLHSSELPSSVRCPFCGGYETDQFSAFGSALSTSQYYCHRCRTVFEFMKRRPG